MRTSLILRSLYPGNPLYTWEAGAGWVLKEANFPLPKHMWLSNQTGIQVGAFGSVDVDSFRSLFSSLPTIYNDLVLDAAEKIGLKDTGSIHPARWGRLSNPRPMSGDVPLDKPVLYAERGGKAYALVVTEKGKGGWYEVESIPEAYKTTSFEVWDYMFYAPESSKQTFTASAARKMVTATLDCLYCFPDDDTLKAYFVWSQSKIKELWERTGNSDESKRTD